MIDKVSQKLKSLLNRTYFRGRNSTAVEIFPDDVFLVSYPKSGNTWMRFLVGNYLTNCNIDFSSSLLVVPDIQLNPHQCAEVEFRPRFIKSHSTYIKAYPKVVYILRDGRDVAVSYYYYSQKMGQLAFDVSFSNFIKGFAKKGTKAFGNWSDHVESWLGAVDSNNLILIKYEDMLSDTARVLEKVIQFAGIEINESRIANAVYASQFEKMQKLEVKQHTSYFAHYGAKTEDIRFVRKGEVGNWRSYFSEEDEDYFLSLHGETLRKMKYVQ